MKRSKMYQLSSLCDEDVMELFQAGNEDAFTELVKRYENRLYNFLFRYNQCHEDVQDLVQETFLRMYRSRNAYERIAKFSTWLFTIGMNLMRSQYKRKNRYQTTSIDNDDSKDGPLFDLPSNDQNPEDATNSAMVIGLVNNAFDSIASEYSELLAMREFKEMSYEEIAGAVQLPMGTVKSRINRGRSRLQHKIRSMNDETLIYAA